MRTFFLISGGVLLGWDFCEWLSSGAWTAIPISALIPNSAQAQHWLFELNPSMSWGDFLTAAFATPVPIVLLIVGWLLRPKTKSAYIPPREFYVVRIAAESIRP